MTEEDKARKILALTEGAFGEIYRLLTELAAYGVVNGEEKISLDHIDKINWVPPYERAKRSLHMS